jgi:hypothetical protein
MVAVLAGLDASYPERWLGERDRLIAGEWLDTHMDPSPKPMWMP